MCFCEKKIDALINVEDLVIDIVKKYLNLDLEIDYELDILDNLQDLNARYMEKNEDTDVLSFEAPNILKQNGYYGEIYLSCAYIKDNLCTFECVVELFIHGLLHLLGYDHSYQDIESQDMIILQKKIVKEVMENLKEMEVFDGES